MPVSGFHGSSYSKAFHFLLLRSRWRGDYQHRYAGLTNLVPAHPNSGLMARRVLEVKFIDVCDYRIAGQFQTSEASRSRKSSALPAINLNTISRRRRLIWSRSVLGRPGERWHPNLSPSYIVRAFSCRVALRLPRFELNRRRGLDTSARPGLLT